MASIDQPGGAIGAARAGMQHNAAKLQRGGAMRPQRLEQLVQSREQRIEPRQLGARLIDGGDHRLHGLVSGARVLGTIVAQGRDRKILIFKKKRRKNYRRRRGHRQSITTVRVTEIA